MPNINDFLEAKAREIAQTSAARFNTYFQCLRQRTESPIEELLLAALLAEHDKYLMDATFGIYAKQFNLSKDLDWIEAPGIFCFLQSEVGAYRVDFLFVIKDGDNRVSTIVAECDGHDFHERTKVQARRDKRRDRDMVSAGIRVLRFAGSEIWADPDRCADTVLHLARNILYRDD